MRLGTPCVLAAMTAAALALAPWAHADVDTDFADELHGYGIYGPKDYKAWLAKVTCDRLGSGRDDLTLPAGALPRVIGSNTVRKGI